MDQKVTLQLSFVQVAILAGALSEALDRAREDVSPGADAYRETCDELQNLLERIRVAGDASIGGPATDLERKVQAVLDTLQRDADDAARDYRVQYELGGSLSTEVVDRTRNRLVGALEVCEAAGFGPRRE